jgi:hypothetical protein
MPSNAVVRPDPLRLFADRPSPRLYDRIVEVLRVRFEPRRARRSQPGRYSGPPA